MEHVPNDVLKYGILMRLPETCVLRFMFTCRRYYALVSSDPEFARRHRQQQGKKKVLIIASDPPLSLDCDSLRTTWLDLPKIEGIDDVSIMGSCHGLICLLYGVNTLVLWNPNTRDFNKLPASVCPLNLKLFGFGYDAAGHDYKLVLVDSEGTGICFMTYSFRSHSVKHTTVPNMIPFVPYERRALYFGDHLHWLVRTIPHLGIRDIILSYNVGKETTDNVPLPDLDDIFCLLGITVIKDSFSMCCHTRTLDQFLFEVWIMKEYGIKSSWTRAYKFECCRPTVFMEWILCSRHDDELIMDTPGDVSVINVPLDDVPLDDEWEELGSQTESPCLLRFRKSNQRYDLYDLAKFRSWTYEESLVSPHSGGLSLDQLAKTGDSTSQSSHGEGNHTAYRTVSRSMMSPARMQISSRTRKRRWDA